jgi:hypothetical protein
VKEIPRRTVRGGREIKLQQIGYVQEDQTNGFVALVYELRNENEIELQIITYMGAHGGALRYKPGKSGVRFQMMSLEFFFDISPAVEQWLRYCATNLKVAGSTPDGVIRIFNWHKSF